MIFSHTARSVPQDEQESILAQARDILIKRMSEERQEFNGPGDAIEYLKLTIGHLPHEEFYVLWLDPAHRLIAADNIEQGTPMEVAPNMRTMVHAGLNHGAAYALLAHNHPGGGNPEFSKPDLITTAKTAGVFGAVGIELIGHVVVSGDKAKFSDMRDIMRQISPIELMRGLGLSNQYNGLPDVGAGRAIHSMRGAQLHLMRGWLNVYRSGHYHRAGKPGMYDRHPGDIYETKEAALADISPASHYVATVPIEWYDPEPLRVNGPDSTPYRDRRAA